MKRNARRAFTALKKLGAPVYDRSEYGAEFILGAELRTSTDTYFADYYQRDIREQVVDGKVINAWGVREDVNVILANCGMRTEWINAAMCGVYQA